MRFSRAVGFGVLTLVTSLALSLTGSAEAQWRAEFPPVDTKHLQTELGRLQLDPEQMDIALGLLSFHDEQIERLTEGDRVIREWAGMRFVPVNGAAQRFQMVFDADIFAMTPTRLHMITRLANQLFDDLRLVLPAHEQTVTRLEQRARRQRVMRSTSFDSSPAAHESTFDALAWVEQGVRDEALRDEIFAATWERATALEASLRAYEEGHPERSVRFFLALADLRLEHDPDERIRIGARLREMLSAMHQGMEQVAANAMSIADIVAGMLPPELVDHFVFTRIYATRAWLDGQAFENPRRMDWNRADEATSAALRALNMRYIRAKDQAARRLRDDRSAAVWDTTWIDVAVASTPEMSEAAITMNNHEAWNAYRDAAAFWREEVAAFQAEQTRLVGHLLEPNR